MNILPLIGQSGVAAQGMLFTLNANSTMSSLALDSSKNIIVVGTLAGTTNDVFVAKYNSTGTLQWQKKLDSTLRDNGSNILIDSSNNIYLSCDIAISGTANNQVIVKLDNSGTIQWQKILKYYYGGGILKITSDNYILISCGSNTLLKIDTNGSLVYSINLTSTSINSFCIDSSNNTLVIGVDSDGTNTFLAKFDASLNLLWKKRILNIQWNLTKDVTTDSSNNIYIINTRTSSTSGIVITKYDTTGTLVWSTKVTPNDGDSSSTSKYLKIISLNNSLYVSADYYSPSMYDWGMLLINLDLNGNLLWSNKFKNNNGDIANNCLIVDSTDIYFTYNRTGDNYSIGVKMPNTGLIPKGGSYTMTGVNASYTQFNMLIDAGDSSEGTASFTPAVNDVTSQYIDYGPYVTNSGGTTQTLGRGQLITDSFGNYYTYETNDTYPATYKWVNLYKFNSLGVLQWQRKISYSSSKVVGYSLVLDSSDNIIIAVLVNDIVATSASSYIVILKYNSSGTLQWQRKLSSPSYSLEFTNIVTNGSDIYIEYVQYKGSWTSYDILLNKLNSSGVSQWLKQITSGVFFGFDSTGNLYFVGDSTYPATLKVSKFSGTDFSSVWTKVINFTGNNECYRGGCYIINDVLYLTGIFQQTTRYSFVIKMDLSGNISYMTQLGSSTNYDSIQKIIVNSDSTVLLVTYNGLIIKLSSTGSVVTNRKLSLNGLGLSTNSNSIVISCPSLLLFLPKDLSIPGTGSYTINGATQTYTNTSYGTGGNAYTTSTFTNTISTSAATITNVAGDATDSSESYTPSVNPLLVTYVDSTLTSAATSLTSNSLIVKD